MDVLLVLENIDLKCQCHLLEAGVLLLNQSNCDPKTSCIHNQSEKRGSLAYNIFIWEGIT